MPQAVHGLEGGGVLPPVVCPLGQRCMPFTPARKYGFCAYVSRGPSVAQRK